MTNSINKFLGRSEELKALNSLWQLRCASIVVVKGRRRIGKSRLVSEFAKGCEFFPFMGLPPTKGHSSDIQRKEFLRQFSKITQKKLPIYTDWGDIFDELADYTKNKKCIILLDEISWMAEGDTTFLGKLKTSWDRLFSQNPQLILILCGSVSTWIEENIIKSTGFFGRPNLIIHLNELSLSDCNKFWGDLGDNLSAYEKFKVLSVTGGIPRYLELIDPKLSAEENIKNLFMRPFSPLVDEFNTIFSDVFLKKSDQYKDIVLALNEKKLNQEQISKITKRNQNNKLSEDLENLCQAGFLVRDNTWHLKTGKQSRLSQYRLSDNYLRFALRYLEPNEMKIKQGLFDKIPLTSLPEWDVIMGLQFENLVINNHHALINALGLNPAEIVQANPFFQRKTSTQRGCQIDYLIQTRFDCIYLCEVRFLRREISSGIIAEVKEKIKRLSLPKHMSIRPVLIHVNGVYEEVIDSQLFAHVICFSEFQKVS